MFFFNPVKTFPIVKTLNNVYRGSIVIFLQDWKKDFKNYLLLYLFILNVFLFFCYLMQYSWSLFY